MYACIKCEGQNLSDWGSDFCGQEDRRAGTEPGRPGPRTGFRGRQGTVCCNPKGRYWWGNQTHVPSLEAGDKAMHSVLQSSL